MATTSHLMPLFVDTNLDTHLIIAVSPQDTVADLKGTIRSEHARCFPKIGEVSVEALKVKWGTSFYHLSDAMPLSFAFNGVTGNWLLHLDLAPTTSIETCQTETTGVTAEASLQPEKHVLHTNRNTSVSLASREDRNKDLVASEMPIEKGLVQKSIDNAHGRETSPDALLQKPSPEVDSSIQNVSSPQKQNMDILSHGPDADVPEMEISVEDATAVGSDHQEKSGQISDLENKERKGEDRANVGTEADVASKKEKSRKRSSSLLNDQLSDGEPEHPYVEKKKRKGKKDQSSKNHVEDQITGGNLETGFFSKEISKSEQPVEKRFQDKHESNAVIPSEVFPSKPSNADFSPQQMPTDIKLKKKKKQHMSKNGEASADEQAHISLSKIDAAPGKQDDVENHGEGLVNTHVDLRKGSDATYLVEGSTEKALDRNSTQLSRTDLSSTNSKKSDSATEKSLNGTTSAYIAIQDDRNDNSGGLLLGNFKTLGKESKDADIRKAGQPNNHACADPEVVANSRHRKFMNEKDTSRKQDATDSSRKQADKGSTDEMSQNSHDKLSNVSAPIMSVSDQNNTIPTKSGVISEIGGKNSQHSRKKKRGGIEPPNTQSGTHDAVSSSPVQVWEEEQNIINSPTDQVRKEDQNKNSIILHQHPAKEFKEIPAPVPAATAGNSVLETSTFPVSPVDKKKKRGHKKLEKIEPHHQELNMRSITLGTVNSSREHVAEEFSKEKSIPNLEHTGEEPEKTSVIGKAVENSATVASLVNANNRNSKRRKKSENIGLPSGHSVRPESIHSLGDNVTEQNSTESLKHIQNKKADSLLGHPLEGSERGGLFEETAVGRNPATGHLIVSLDPSDKKSKRSRKKSGKSKMPVKEASEDGAINPLVKASTKENTGRTLNGGSTSMGENPELETIIRENATLKSTGELDSVVAFAAEDRNFCHGEKNKAKTVLIDNPINYGRDHSSENNNEEITRISIKSSGSKSRVNSDEDDQNVDHAKPYSPDSIGLGESSDKHETGCLSAEHASEDNAIEAAKAREETGIETVQGKIHNGTAESLEAKDHGQLAEFGSGKIDDFNFFDPKENQLEPVKELSSMETEGKKQNMEKSKRKKKLNPSPQHSSLPKPLVSEERGALKKKSQSNDSGKHSLGDTAVQIAGELKSRKKHGKKATSSTHDPDLHLHDVSSAAGFPRRPNDDDRRGKKTKDCESSAQVLLSVDEENKHPSRKNLMSAGRQSLTNNEGNILMVSAGQVPKQTDFDASVSNSPGGAFVTQNNYNAVANVAAVGDTDGLVASSDSTEEGTTVLKKRYRVAVRKVPRGKVQTKLHEEKTSVTPATIFDNASGSSEDEFEISNRPTLTKATSDNSSTSHDSDVDLEETQASYKISPGAPSTSYHKALKGTNDTRNVMEPSSKTKRSKPLSAILKAISSYKKAKLIASQSGDSESQDVVPETQPELAFL